MSETSIQNNLDDLGFEAALDQLQQAVKKLESGELSLEHSLRFFEEGVRLARVCQKHLAAAEQKVEILMKVSADGQIELRPFSTSATRS